MKMPTWPESSRRPPRPGFLGRGLRPGRLRGACAGDKATGMLSDAGGGQETWASDFSLGRRGGPLVLQTHSLISRFWIGFTRCCRELPFTQYKVWPCDLVLSVTALEQGTCTFLPRPRLHRTRVTPAGIRLQSYREFCLMSNVLTAWKAGMPSKCSVA